MGIFSATGKRVISGICLAAAPLVFGQNRTDAATVHIVWMGGNDCPPCIYWRGHELPKLEKSAEFKAIKFSYVSKVIRSSIPSSIFLPSEVKPYKEKLDFASSGFSGSPQVAILVNGEVFDYFHGTRNAEEIERMIVAIRTGGQYPFQRCVKASREWHKCDLAG